METLYLVCAALGGTVLIIQTLLLLFGGGHGDVDADVDLDLDDTVDVHSDLDQAHDTFLKVLSLKTVVAFMTFFGLAGLACVRAEAGTVMTLGVSVGAGMVAVYIVAWLMASLSRLQSRGNLDLRNAVGSSGVVYLRIPAGRSGSGRVTVAVQGRKVECKAVTDGEEIPSGAPVRIVGLSGPDTFEVSV